MPQPTPMFSEPREPHHPLSLSLDKSKCDQSVPLYCVVLPMS